MNFAVIGSNTSESLSPKLHNFIYKLLNLNNSYSFLEVDEIEYSILLEYSGLNITSPFKNKIIKYINELDPIAQETQSVNCIKTVKDQIFGYNTDYYGFNKSMIQNKIDFYNKKIIVLGAGGVSSTICKFLNDNKFNFKILNRTSKNLDILKKRLSLDDNKIADTNYLKELDVDTVINCLSPSASSEEYLKTIGLFDIPIDTYIDINYNISENIISNINANRMVDGLDMLIFQAIKSIEIWMENDILQGVDYQSLHKHIMEN